ncbi:MAG: endonuclease III [Actinobacteria bacterium]|nr:MAG: endonuclease III [Actinomycetota bacterium]
MPSSPSAQERRNARVILNRLTKLYPDVGTALDYVDPWQLLVSTVLSAQTTDQNVNKVAPTLFERYPTPEDLAGADPEDVERIIYSTGYYRQKTKSVIALAGDLVDKYDGEVPADLEKLVELRGVGRKTASVVLSEVWGIPAIAVDTHVKRVANRLGLTPNTDPVKVESDLMSLYPRDRWVEISMTVIRFGRDVCNAKKPQCWSCPLRDRCAYDNKTIRPNR